MACYVVHGDTQFPDEFLVISDRPLYRAFKWPADISFNSGITVSASRRMRIYGSRVMEPENLLIR